MGLGAIAAAELLGGGKSLAAGSGPLNGGDAGPDLGKLAPGQLAPRA